MTDQLRDLSNNPVDRFKAGDTQTIALGAASLRTANPFRDSCSLVEVTCTQPAFINIGPGNPTADAADRYLAADRPYQIAVNPGEKLAALQAGTGGDLYVTELL